MHLRFPKSRRLSSRADYDAIFEARVRLGDARLLVYARRSGLPYSRLGLSVSRRVGNAVRRNRFKRLLREAFRLQPDLPAGYDWVVVVRPHEPQALAAYMSSLSELTRALTLRLEAPGATRSPGAS